MLQVGHEWDEWGSVADVVFEFPAARVAGGLAPEFEGPDLGQVGLETDGDDVAFGGGSVGDEGGFEGGEFLEIFGRSAVEDEAGGVGSAGGGAEEAELGGLADDQAELGAGDLGLGAFLHTHRNDADGLDWRFDARDGGGGGFHADVVGPGDPSSNPDASAGADGSVVGGASGDGEVEVGGFQEGNGFAGPGREDLHESVA